MTITYQVMSAALHEWETICPYQRSQSMHNHELPYTQYLFQGRQVTYSLSQSSLVSSPQHGAKKSHNIRYKKLGMGISSRVCKKATG